MKQNKNKALKIAGITVGSILAVIILVLAIAASIIFSPKRLTPVVSKALDKYFPGKAEISSVGLTYFKTRPYLGIDIRGVTIYDEKEGSPFEKLLDIGSLAVSFDVKSYLKEDKIIVKGLYLDKTHANLYTAPDGTTNIDFLTDGTSEEPEDDGSTTLNYAELRSLSFKDLNASYRNDSTGISASVNDSRIDLRGLLNLDSIEVSMTARIGELGASITDSTTMNAGISGISIEADAVKLGQNGSLLARLSTGPVTADNGAMHAASDGISFTGSDISFETDGYMPTSARGKAALLVKKIQANSNSGMSARTDDISIDLREISFKKGLIAVTSAILNAGEISYTSVTDGSETSAKIDSLNLLVSAECDTAMTDITSAFLIHSGDIQLITKDDSSSLNLLVRQPRLDASASVCNESIRLEGNLGTNGLNTVMNGETMTDNWPLTVNLKSLETDTALTHISIADNSFIEVNGERIAFGAKADRSESKVSGNARAKVESLNIEKIISMIPQSYRGSLEGIDVKGTTDLEASIRGYWTNNTATLQRISANISATDFYASLFDSIEVGANKLNARLESPDGHAAIANIESNDLDVMMIAESVIRANLKDVSVKANIKDIADSLMAMTASAQVDVKDISASMDTISATLRNASMWADMHSVSEIPTFSAKLGFDRLNAELGESMSAQVGKTSMNASAQYDSTQTDIFGKWDPQLNFTVDRSYLEVIEDPITLEGLDVNFTQGSFNIKEGKLSLGNSNIELWGDIYNIGPFLRDEGLLTGELYLESDFVDVTQLMEYTTGLGQDESVESTKTAQLPSDTIISDTIESVPFVVPRGIDLSLYTNFSEIEFNHHTFNNVGGDITVKDGKVIMQEVGFSSNTAEMQLTAIYNAPEEDNRFIELDFHLLDIQIDELIDLIPSVDSIVPMLKAFKGEAQFHLAAETKLQRDNMPKMSTLMGAASIEGKDLVIMDNEVFKGIKRKLLMSKKAQNKIDDLSIEMQVLREKVDLYPFLIHMDKYNAVIGGRHNINKGLDCRYHISLTDSPLPFRLGVTVSGPIEAISDKPLKHIKLSRCEYDKLFKPSKRSDVEERTLSIRRDIAETLKSNVR